MSTAEIPTSETPGAAPEAVELRSAARRALGNVRAGELGILPIVVALAIITAFFTAKNTNFVSGTNFINILVQLAGTATIAIGVVYVLLLGEIDLSIGFVSGVAGVVVSELQRPDLGVHHIGGVAAILLALVAGALIGAFQGSFVSFLGVPSFVVTLAGLLAWQGVILIALGVQGVIAIQNSLVNDLANYYLSHTVGWILAGVGSLTFAAATLGAVYNRRRHGIRGDNLAWIGVKVLGFAALVWLAVGYANRDGTRGFPFAGLLVVALVVVWQFIAERTTFGRHVYAVGGNAEAARRAGINVRMIRLVVFMISGAMAAFGGCIFAARLSSVDLNAGGGTILLDAISAAVIGGVSLFGGRGRVQAALLGALVIAMIANGSDLVGWSSGRKYVITGVILLAAVTLDTVARRRQAASGR
jgi:D-xylose transport system permease protein